MNAGPTRTLAQLERIERKLDLTPTFAPPVARPQPARSAPAEPSGPSTGDNRPRDTGEAAWQPEKLPVRTRRRSNPDLPAPQEQELPKPQLPPQRSVAWPPQRSVAWGWIVGCILVALLLTTFWKDIWLRLQPPLEVVMLEVADGDSVDVSIAGAERQRVDIADIDAPDRSTPAGAKSRAYLAQLLRGASVRLWPGGERPDGRPIMIVRANGSDVARVMALAGHAQPCDSLMRDPQVAVAAWLARLLRHGMWAKDAPSAAGHLETDRNCGKPDAAQT